MYHKTVAAMQRAHQLDSDLLIASSMLIERRAFYEDLTSSFAQLQELARKRPRTAWVHDVFGEVLRAAGAPEKAERECDIVRQLEPEFFTGNCVVLRVHMGKFDKAREEIIRTPGDFNTMMLGQILLREGRVEEALPKLKAIPAGMQRELIRDCWPDSSTESAQQRRDRRRPASATLRSPMRGTLEPRCRLFSIAKMAQFGYCRRPPTIASVFTPTLIPTLCSIRFATRRSSRLCVKQASLARRNSRPTRKCKFSRQRLLSTPLSAGCRVATNVEANTRTLVLLRSVLALLALHPVVVLG